MGPSHLLHLCTIGEHLPGLPDSRDRSAMALAQWCLRTSGGDMFLVSCATATQPCMQQQLATRGCTPTSGSGMAWLGTPLCGGHPEPAHVGRGSPPDDHAVSAQLEGQRKVTAGQQGCHRVPRCLLLVSLWFLTFSKSAAQVLHLGMWPRAVACPRSLQSPNCH